MIFALDFALSIFVSHHLHSDAEDSDDSSEGSSYEPGGGSDEDDIDLAEFEKEDLADIQEEKMPARKKAPKTPPRPTRRSSRTPTRTPTRTAASSIPDPPQEEVEVVEDLTSLMNTLTVGGNVLDPYSMMYLFPRLRYQYTMNRRQTENIELFVPTMPNEYFRPFMDPSGMSLSLSIRIPKFFTSAKRQLSAFSEDATFTSNTHANTAYQAVSQQVRDDHDDGDVENAIWSEPLEYPLSMKCEEDILWEVQFFQNNLGDLTDELGGQQFFAVLVIRCTSVVKPKSANKGGTRVISKDLDESDEVEED